MRLVHRSAVEALIQPATVDRMINGYLTEPVSLIQREQYVERMVKDKTAYAIFSHRWLVGGELTFQDLSKLESIDVAGLNLLINRPLRELKKLRGAVILDQAMASTPNGNAERNGIEVFKKIQELCDRLSDQDHCATDLVKLVKFCEAALRYKCDYVWLDTGCINKQSSAELEESIRSMFSWYRNSKMCIVHLSQTSTLSDMAQDPWFTRGWTLQELLAPTAMKFFSKSWHPLTSMRNDKVWDHKSGIPLWKTISKITQIPVVQLLGFKPGTINIRERMVWASRRKTTRIEDMAYCLIGIFNIPLSIAYGEGQMAFYRLQVEILQHSHDRGLFAWNGSASSRNSMFAAGPEAFFPLRWSLLTTEEDIGSADPTYMLTNYGLRIPLSIYEVQRIEAVDMDNGVQSTYKLEAQGLLGKIEVAFDKSLSEDTKLTIGILGNGPDDVSLAIVLISSKIGSIQYERMPTNVIKLPSCNVKREAWKVIFIK